MIRRIRDAIRRWWRTGGHGQHARPRGDDFDAFIDLGEATIVRKPVLGRPPWETAPLPAVCLFPETAAPALLTSAPGPELHPIVAQVLREQLGTDSIAEYVRSLFAPVNMTAAA